eukprot:5573355-Amphidinium_carterae.1
MYGSIKPNSVQYALHLACLSGSYLNTKTCLARPANEKSWFCKAFHSSIVGGLFEDVKQQILNPPVFCVRSWREVRDATVKNLRDLLGLKLVGWRLRLREGMVAGTTNTRPPGVVENGLAHIPSTITP